jgi:hypothetical protein
VRFGPLELEVVTAEQLFDLIAQLDAPEGAPPAR